MEHQSVAMYNVRIFIAMMICVAFILFTIASALGAQMVRYINPVEEVTGYKCADIDAAKSGELDGDLKMDGSGLYMVEIMVGDVATMVNLDDLKSMDECTILMRKKFELASAALNLAIIGLYGLIFEALAEALCEWENHRTESEFENANFFQAEDGIRDF
eukprot:COSAG02_NODE_18448_length_938_cov_0.753278_1_plen_160_part_00